LRKTVTTPIKKTLIKTRTVTKNVKPVGFIAAINPHSASDHIV
jgi:hypothetical protein